jgi:redox-sensitive bicupin YhaK (pirin superfamily)
LHDVVRRRERRAGHYFNAWMSTGRFPHLPNDTAGPHNSFYEAANRRSMKEFAVSQSAVLVRSQPRQIAHRTRGQRHGAITRLMSPGDLGQILKPFVFLDLFDMEGASFSGFGLHPHSGIATVTHIQQGSVRYEDTTGAKGILPEGGVEWFKAGHGAWHGGGPGDSGRTRGFQLWLALPTEHELGPVESIYQAPDALQRDGSALVLLGGYGDAKSPLRTPSPVNYLSVRLKAGESWRYVPPPNHTVAWAALSSGRLAVPDPIHAGELVAFESSNEPIDFHAFADTEFVLGSAVPHPHRLVLGYYSVHTSPETLIAGERRIDEIRARLQEEGRL